MHVITMALLINLSALLSLQDCVVLVSINPPLELLAPSIFPQPFNGGTKVWAYPAGNPFQHLLQSVCLTFDTIAGCSHHHCWSNDHQLTWSKFQLKPMHLSLWPGKKEMAIHIIQEQTLTQIPWDKLLERIFFSNLMVTDDINILQCSTLID